MIKPTRVAPVLIYIRAYVRMCVLIHWDKKRGIHISLPNKEERDLKRSVAHNARHSSAGTLYIYVNTMDMLQ